MKPESIFAHQKTAKWIIGVVSICILIYLGIQNMDTVVSAVAWVFDLLSSILIGGILALILNVPMRSVESHLFSKTTSPRLKRFRRPCAIFIAFLIIIGIIVGVAFLVVPELAEAAVVLFQSFSSMFDYMAALNSGIHDQNIPFVHVLEHIDINWEQIKTDLLSWLSDRAAELLQNAAAQLTVIGNQVVEMIVGIVFAVYFLSGKEKMTSASKRILRVWIPEHIGKQLLHIASVGNSIFHRFVVGQMLEAIILGSLCTIGMAILQLPYAPMIGALVGVTALIPIVGAFVGTIVGAFMILTVNPFQAAVFVIYLLILQQIEGNLIYPRVVGSSLGLPAMWVLVAVSIGGRLAGPLGMLLGVPIIATLHFLINEATEQKEARITMQQQKKLSSCPPSD